MSMSNQPYIGLRPFERHETDIFFGREQHSDELINRLGNSHFLAVIGTSGCGKSSLVKTGLMAGLEAGYLAKAGTHWRIVEIRPGQQPFEVLATQLFAQLNDILPSDYTAKRLEQTLRQGSLSLHELLARYPLPSQAQLLIVCDQFEEIFRFQQQSNAEAAVFVSLLLASSQPYPLSTLSVSHSLYVVITMRSDFLGDCAQFSGLAEAINNGLYLTPRLDEQQLCAAIEEPAFVFNGAIEPTLVRQLLEDVGNNPDQLPLLQHLLMRLWNSATDNTDALTLADYNGAGRLVNILSRHADEIYTKLNNEQKYITEVLFRNLTESDSGKHDTRRPIQLAKMIKLTGMSFTKVVTVIDRFRQVGCCFLMPPIDVMLEPKSMIDISHESLIRQWQRLKEWTADEAENAKTYLRLEDRASEWQKNKSNLLQSPELEIYQQWWQEKNPSILWAKRYGEKFQLTKKFLLVSEQVQKQALLEKAQVHEKRQKTKLSITVSLVLGLVGLAGLGGYYYYGYIKESVTYCNATAKRFGVLECIGEISIREIEKRKISYQFIRNGAFNPIQKVQAINSEGECTDKHSSSTYLETENGQVVVDSSVNKKIEDKTLKECQWEYIYDKDGKIIYEKSYDKNNTLVSTTFL